MQNENKMKMKTNIKNKMEKIKWKKNNEKNIN
jgi:hypothetical protein